MKCGSAFQIWLLTLSLLTVDPPWNQQSTLLIIDRLTVDRWPSHCWLLIVDCFAVDCWPSHCWLLILPPPLESTVNSVDHQSPHCWLLTLSLLTVDRRLLHCWLLIVNHLTVDRWPSHCLSSTCALCREQWDLCAPKTFRAKHGLATSIV